MQAGSRAFMSFNYEKAEREFEAALALTQTFPPNDLRTAETLSGLASLYTWRESKFADAETRQKQAVAIFESSEAPDDLRLACGRIGLALVYEFEGKREEAAPIWAGYFPLLEKAARPLDPGVLSTMIDLRRELRHLATQYHQDSDAETAETRILAIDEKAFGPDSPQTGNDAQSLGQRYEREGRYGAAFPLLLRSLEISRKAYSMDRSVSGVHRDAATAWDVTVAMLELPLFHENVPGPFLDAHWGNSHDLLRQCKKLARVAAESGKYPEAEQLYRQIISLDTKDASSNKRSNITGLAEDWVDLSRVYRHEHRYDDAMDAIGRSEGVDEGAAKVKFADPKQVLLLHWYSQNEMAEIYREKGDLAAARPLFERSLEITEKIPLGERHPRIAELQSDYAALLVDEGKFDEAESSYKRALDNWANRYGWNPEHLEHAETLSNYAALLRKLNRPTEAEPFEAQASGIRRRAAPAEPR
jgi:tetratricopeptide (TPR) repeat protein